MLFFSNLPVMSCMTEELQDFTTHIHFMSREKHNIIVHIHFMTNEKHDFTAQVQGRKYICYPK